MCWPRRDGKCRRRQGLAPDDLELRGVINIDTGADVHGARPGVIVFVFRASLEARGVAGSAEGMPEWIPADALADYWLVDDLVEIIPRVLADGPIFYGQYSPQADGALRYRFTP